MYKVVITTLYFLFNSVVAHAQVDPMRPYGWQPDVNASVSVTIVPTVTAKPSISLAPSDTIKPVSTIRITATKKRQVIKPIMTATPTVTNRKNAWQLEAIVVIGEFKKAVISGQEYAIGEQVMGFTVTQINPESVLLMQEDLRKELTLTADQSGIDISQLK